MGPRARRRKKANAPREHHQACGGEKGTVDIHPWDAKENIMSSVSLCMRLQVAPFGWEEFCAAHGPYTIGLDGYVAAVSRFDPSGPRLNLDHHTEVDRLVTRATCAQVLLAIRLAAALRRRRAMKQKATLGTVNEVPNGAKGGLSVPGEPATLSQRNGTSADLPGELEQLRARARERDRFLDLLRRTRADFEDYQKRAGREREEERRYQHGPLALDLLPVLDNLERATAAAERAGDTGPLAQGVDLVRATFLDVLRRHGMTPVNALGQKFDPNLHHAVMTTTVPGEPSGIVVQVIREGYRVHERLLRPADVVVTVTGGTKAEPREQAATAGPHDVIDRASWDIVDQASWESFPASDAPPWTLGYTGPPATD
jgi:molecular chaperone GrpE